MRAFLTRLHQDTSGAAMAVFALALPPLIGSAAVAVDFGSLFLAERSLQGIADAAAAASLQGSTESEAHDAAVRTINANGARHVSVDTLEIGAYRRDADTAIDDRFDPAAADKNAVRIGLTQDVPLFFGSFFLGEGQTRVHAKAVAARQDVIAFDIGTKLVSASDGIPNQILSALAGSALGLTNAQVAALAANRIDVIEFADQLRRLQEQPQSTFGQAFDRTTDIAVAVRAMAAATEDLEMRETLLDISYKLELADLTISDLIDLGPYSDMDINDGRDHATVDAYSLLRNLLELAHPEGFSFSVDLAAAGLASSRLHVVGGGGYERSPWLSLTSAYEVVLRTANTRLSLVSTVALPGATVRLPLYAELAAGEARVSSVDCPAALSGQTATLAVTPSLGELALADLDSGDFNDMSSELSFKSAQLVNTALVRINGRADISLGGSTEQTVEFTRADIDDGVRKTVGTHDLFRTLATSVLDDVELQVAAANPLLSLGTSSLTDIVGSALATVAPSLDSLLTGATDALGVKVGASDVGIIGLRCGRPVIVA